LFLPPEERFWKRYSPHNEFSVSGATSVALHALAIGLLILIFWMLWRPSLPAADLPLMEPVAIAPDRAPVVGPQRRPGGNPDGDGLLKEAVPNQAEEDAGSDVESKVLEDPPDPPVRIPDVKDGSRPIAQGNTAATLKELKERAERVLGNRQGQPGKGGKGKDKDGGPGGKGEVEARQRQRQLRWRILFNQNNAGEDYLDKLRALNAILLAPEYKLDAKGKRVVDDQGRPRLRYRLVIRDLTQSPAKPKPEAVRKIEGIFWIDDNADSVTSLAKALGIPAPPLFACFFSSEVERALRKLEKGKFAGDELAIEETRFRVVEAHKGPYKGKTRRYALVCDKVVLREEDKGDRK
jgi:hypothetical protein